jgi:hypothetical protein
MQTQGREPQNSQPEVESEFTDSKLFTFATSDLALTLDEEGK